MRRKIRFAEITFSGPWKKRKITFTVSCLVSANTKKQVDDIRFKKRALMQHFRGSYRDDFADRFTVVKTKLNGKIIGLTNDIY